MSFFKQGFLGGTLLLASNLFALESVNLYTWLEYSKGHEYDIVLNGYIAEFRLNEKFSLVAASAIGIEQENETRKHNSTAKDLALYPMYTFAQPSENGTPGFSVMAGVVLPTGHNFLSSPNTGYLAIANMPVKLFDDRLSVLTQLGHRHIDVVDGEDVDRLYWGMFAEANIVNEYNLFTNFYTGSPFEIDVPSLSQEYGFSYTQSKNLKYILLFGIQPELAGVSDADTTEYWGELGVELTLDFLQD